MKQNTRTLKQGGGKPVVKLNESQLREIIKESIENVLNGESTSETSLEEGFGSNMLGAIRGAYNGYKGAQNLSNAQNQQNAIQNAGGQQTQFQKEKMSIIQGINRASEYLGFASQHINDNKKNAMYYAINVIKRAKTEIDELLQMVEQSNIANYNRIV